MRTKNNKSRRRAPNCLGPSELNNLKQGDLVITLSKIPTAITTIPFNKIGIVDFYPNTKKRGLALVKFITPESGLLDVWCFVDEIEKI